MKIKPLVWQGIDYLIAYSPAAPRNHFSIFYEQEKFWADWDMSIPGAETAEELQKLAQEHHNKYIKGFIENGV